MAVALEAVEVQVLGKDELPNKCREPGLVASIEKCLLDIESDPSLIREQIKGLQERFRRDIPES